MVAPACCRLQTQRGVSVDWLKQYPNSTWISRRSHLSFPGHCRASHPISLSTRLGELGFPLGRWLEVDPLLPSSPSVHISCLLQINRARAMQVYISLPPPPTHTSSVVKEESSKTRPSCLNFMPNVTK